MSQFLSVLTRMAKEGEGAAPAASAPTGTAGVGDVHVDTAIGNERKPKRRANEVSSEKLDGYVPPEEVQSAARRALTIRASKPESQRGMTAVGIARARDLSNGRAVSLDTVRRMKAYFDRHQSDKKGQTWDDEGPGYQAWLGWGGDAGYAWAKRIVAQEDVDKSDWFLSATITKSGPTGAELWAWASVSEVNGEPVVDSQGDMIDPEDLEKAADDFMTNSRDMGLMHTTTGHGRVVQSMFFSKELQSALGIDLGRVGWLVKMQVTDPDVQKAIASGELRELSIGGSGVRVPVETEGSSIGKDVLFDESKHPRGEHGRFIASLNIDKKEMKAIEDYTGFHYVDVNKNLRYGHRSTKDTKRIIPALEGVIKRSKLPRAVNVYRGITGRNFDELKELNPKVGDVFEDKGFFSTSENLEVAKINKMFSHGHGAVFSIYAPEGTNALPVAELTQNPREAEIIFQRGTKFKVVGVNDDKSEWRLEVVP